ncbi:hypothetical protein QUF90_27430 [Desulfococcaceae bacterium HSG9]|nr:hypothetical protein [Desulfococcaceae bacterium HSG9]
MNTIGNASIQPHFTTLTDPRQKGKTDYLSLDITVQDNFTIIS